MSDDITTELEEKLITELASTSCERDELRNKLDASERAAAAKHAALVAFCGWYHRPTDDQSERLGPLVIQVEKALSSDAGRDYVPKAKLDASERACAEMREVLDIAKHYVLALPLEGTLGVEARINCALSSDAGRDYVSLAFHEQEMKDLERERQYVADKLMQKGDHSLPEAVDRWVSDYVPREKLERAQMGCALVRSLAVVLRANHSPEHQAYKIAQDIEERLADRGHDYAPKAEVDAVMQGALVTLEAWAEALGKDPCNNDNYCRLRDFLAARDARKEGGMPKP